MASNFKILKSINSEYYWVLTSINGKIILTSSETYVSKQGALNGIESSKRNVKGANFDRFKTQSSSFYFLQKATNGKILGKSEMYTTRVNLENGIKSVMTNAPKAQIIDLT